MVRSCYLSVNVVALPFAPISFMNSIHSVCMYLRKNITLIFFPIHLQMANDNPHSTAPAKQSTNAHARRATGKHIRTYKHSKHTVNSDGERIGLRFICPECLWYCVVLGNEINDGKERWRGNQEQRAASIRLNILVNTYRQHSSHGLCMDNGNVSSNSKPSKSRTDNYNRNGETARAAFDLTVMPEYAGIRFPQINFNFV